MRKFLVVATALLALSVNSGCTYLHDRLKDAVDITGLKIVAGPGAKFGLGAGATKTGLMFGYYRFEKFGYQGRAMGVWEETGLEFAAPADHHLEAVWGNKELFDSVEEFQKLDGVASRAALFDEELTYPRRRFHTPDGFHVADIDPGIMYPPTPFWLGLGDIQFTMAVFLGVEINFSIFQFADFLAGWLYMDIAKDDTRNYTPTGPKEEE